MIIVLNGYPGVGKLTIGRELAPLLKAKLLDIHTIYNLAFALTEFKSPKFKETVERVEVIAHELILDLPTDQAVVLTTVLAGQSDWGDAEWNRILQLAQARPPLCVVHVRCDLEENKRRIQSEGRAASRKPRDPEMAVRNQAEAKILAGSQEPILLELDTTDMTALLAAEAIAEWVQTR